MPMSDLSTGYFDDDDEAEKENNDKFKTMKIHGLSFSWKRALGVTRLKQDFAKATGIPTTRNGIERKIGNAVINSIFGKRNEK